MITALPLASARLSKLRILVPNHLIDGDLSVLQLQTQQLLMSEIRSHIEYLIQLVIFLCSFYSQNWWKSSLTDSF